MLGLQKRFSYIQVGIKLQVPVLSVYLCVRKRICSSVHECTMKSVESSYVWRFIQLCKKYCVVFFHQHKFHVGIGLLIDC